MVEPDHHHRCYYENGSVAPTTIHVRVEHEYLHSKPTFNVFCKADPHYLLSIRDGKVVLEQLNPASVFQVCFLHFHINQFVFTQKTLYWHWYKDERYSATVKDERGRRAFSLVNKDTGQPLKHSIGASHPVQLKLYNGDVVDKSVLWVMGCLAGDGFRSVRMVNNVRPNLDASQGNEENGGVYDGIPILFWEWNKGHNQRWRICPHHS